MSLEKNEDYKIEYYFKCKDCGHIQTGKITGVNAYIKQLNATRLFCGKCKSKRFKKVEMTEFPGYGCWECKHGCHDGCGTCKYSEDAYDSPLWKTKEKCPVTGDIHLIQSRRGTSSINLDGKYKSVDSYSFKCVNCGEQFRYNSDKGDKTEKDIRFEDWKSKQVN